MNKKFLLIIILCFSILLIGCGKNKNTEAEKPETKIQTNKSANDKNTAVSNEQKSKNVEDADSENTDILDEPVENETQITGQNVKLSREVLKNLMDNSDYISRVRIQVGQDNTTDVSFLEDYKGDLSSVVIELPKNLLQNREYIIFYRDNVNGKIEPVRGAESFIEVQSGNDATLNYIESIYQKNDMPTVKNNTSSNK
ncbi:hypothetical protein [Peptoniphilus sp. oral taxon 386]|uniref:hypothetical protein n=1 Tax=Peptoniphilus sp. oral taxon 386 TaxID=652713 RepID=UPI0001DA9A3F|nr:hypothetical protein [Peptoniphilus sp. oral taxon 386]EFI41881.1 hypothetical protein HMPREF0629_00510 [Peptoniphilus sp. oral taxon 386 str. F0131]